MSVCIEEDEVVAVASDVVFSTVAVAVVVPEVCFAEKAFAGSCLKKKKKFPLK